MYEGSESCLKLSHFQRVHGSVFSVILACPESLSYLGMTPTPSNKGQYIDIDGLKEKLMCILF